MRNRLRVILSYVPRGNQLARQWQLLEMIQHPAGIAVDDVARKLDRTVRAVGRDRSVLQGAGTATSAFDKIGRALSRDGVLHAEKIVQASGGFTHAPEC